MSPNDVIGPIADWLAGALWSVCTVPAGVVFQELGLGFQKEYVRAMLKPTVWVGIRNCGNRCRHFSKRIFSKTECTAHSVARPML
jgi:hypothetical protein